MATTAALRKSFPEFITNAAIPRCDFSTAVGVVFPAGGSAFPKGYVTLKVHPKTRQVWRAVAAVMLAYGYQFRELAGGTLACRKITGGTGTTLHAHGIADDHNPSKNAYRVTAAGGLIQWGKQTDMPAAMVRAIEAIKLTNGLHPIEWGGRWVNIKDPMHYQLDVLASQLQPVNLATLPAGSWAAYLEFEKTPLPTPGPTPSPTPSKGDPMLGLNIGKTGAPLVVSLEAKTLQAMLVQRGFSVGPSGVDGKAGNDTRAAFHAWKVANGITAATGSAGDGVLGAYEYAKLNAAGGTGGGITSAQLTAAVNDAREDAGAALTLHAQTRAGTKVHPHGHDEGQTGPAI